MFETDEVSREERALLRSQQLRLILAHTEFATLAATAFALFLALQINGPGLHSPIPQRTIYEWVLVKLAVAAVRIGHAYVLRSDTGGLRTEWRRFTVPLLALDGAVWGLGGAAMMASPLETWTVIAASLCGVACVATFGLQWSFAATCGYVAPIIAPLSIGLLARADRGGTIAGVGLAVFMALMLSTAKKSERQMLQSQRLKQKTETVSAELRDALELAQRHSEAKDRFLSIISHELRTPLHGIRGLAKLARSELSRAQAHLHYRLELIDDAGRHLQRLVNDLLDISIIEAGRLQLINAPFELGKAVRQLVEGYKEQGTESGIRLELLIEPDLETGHVFGDSDRLIQILHNIVQNAFKFSPVGSVIFLGIARNGPGTCVSFEVVDNGPGMDPTDIDVVFEAFIQGQVRPGSRPEGVGLGLAISRQLARAMGGDVTCESKLGKGSRFTLKIPLQATEAPPVVRDDPPHAEMLVATRQLSGLQVWVAEDDTTSSIISGSVVARLGMSVEEISDGAALVERFKRASIRPAIILMDWDLPGMNGMQATVAIREHESAHDLEGVIIIGISANAEARFAVAALESGMDRWMVKPVLPTALIEAMRATAVLRNKGRPATASEYGTLES